MGGDYDAVLKLRTALADEYWAGGPSCPVAWPAHASWDTDSNEWEPVHGPGDQGTVQERSDASSKTQASARFAQQPEEELTPDETAALQEHKRVRDLRLNSDSIPYAYRGSGDVGESRLALKKHRRLRLGGGGP
jgi:hypothetical protein